MKKHLPLPLLALFLGGLSSANCDERKKEPDANLAMGCLAVCQSLGCADNVDVLTCTGECIQYVDDAEALGGECAQVFGQMLECLAPLGCVGVIDWAKLRGKDFSYSCRDETEMFIDQCPTIWFANE